MLKQLRSKVVLFFSLLALSACAATLDNSPAQTAPRALTNAQLTVEEEGTVIDPYYTYIEQQFNQDEQIDSSQMPAPSEFETASLEYMDPYGEPAKPPQSRQQAHARKIVKVAVLVPLSGPHKDIGQSMLNAAQLALFDIGAEGVELLPKDTKGTEQGALMAAQSALNDRADLVLGPLFADNVKAVKGMISRAGIYNIAFSTDWTAASGNTLLIGIMPFSQIERITSYVTALNHDNFALIAQKGVYGDIVLSSFAQALRRHGARLEAELMLSPLDQDVSDQIRDFVAYDRRKAAHEEALATLEAQLKANPGNRSLTKELAALKQVPTLGDLPYETYMVAIGGEDAKTLINLLRFYDVDQRNSLLIGTGLWDDAGLIAEPAMNGAMFASPSPSARAEFERNYDKIYGQRPPRIASIAYDATALAAVLAEQAYQNGYAGGQIYSAASLFNPNGFAGVDGIFRFRRNGLPERGLAVLEIQNGNLIVRDAAPVTFAE